jgi:hypothetical protein
VGKLWGGVVILTTEEWNVCESDNPALSYSPSDYTHNLQVRKGGREGRREGGRLYSNTHTFDLFTHPNCNRETMRRSTSERRCC